MLKYTAVLSLFTCILFATPIQNTSLEEIEEEIENEQTRESSWNEEEELTVLHKKGSRPQVIEIPTKTSLPSH
jgi:hypothetical protein